MLTFFQPTTETTHMTMMNLSAVDAAIMLPFLIVASFTISQNNAFQSWPFGARSQNVGGTFPTQQQPHLRRRRKRELIEIPTDHKSPRYPVQDWLEFELRFLDMVNSLSMSMSMVSGSEQEVCPVISRDCLVAMMIVTSSLHYKTHQHYSYCFLSCLLYQTASEWSKRNSW